MINEFKDFINRGNVVDLAVGIIIGAAFTKIVDSLVNDVIMPLIGRIIGGVDFSNLYVNLSGGKFESLDAAKKAGAATLNYGVFFSTIFQFLIVAFAVFLLVKGVNSMRKKQEATPPPPPKSETLLAEIRDLLKK
ncbi:MAG: large conductance mechanosensitive channel protein MscL [Alphaproteobacteria bacterium]|nr:large conductance mechanosensitive channel protein MscL [Alphaproteobacteria bacterium]